MSSIRNFLNNSDINRFRFYFQLFAFVLLMYGGYLAINIGDQLPTFACVFGDKRGGSCYLMGFQHQMTFPYARLFSGAGIGVLTGLFTFIVYLSLRLASVITIAKLQDCLRHYYH